MNDKCSVLYCERVCVRVYVFPAALYDSVDASVKNDDDSNDRIKEKIEAPALC